MPEQQSRSGTADDAADYAVPGLLHSYLVTARIAKGRPAPAATALHYA